jgi:L-lactate dehydrogenase (cytochrome)
MKSVINPSYPDIEYLRAKAKKRIPGFAFDYLENGCNSEVNLKRNTDELRNVQLKPNYLKDYNAASLKTELFGHTYDAPFGVSAIGLQGLIWPRASEILAKAAFEHNIPYMLSTVATANLETISEITEGNAWFQLYHPVEAHVTDNIINRCAQAGYKVLVLLCDVPSFGYRPKDVKNGLAMPPKMTLNNMLQIVAHPQWAINTLIAGSPHFANLDPYMPKGLSLQNLGLFMNKTFSGRLNESRIKAIRDKWKGKLVLKGVASEEDTEKAIEWGLDGIIVSNHGGRQLDAGESTIKSLKDLSPIYRDKIKILMDSGIRTGADIASTLAAGADFTFLGRTFMYGVAALGKDGGDHTMALLKKQLQQVMEQVGSENVRDMEKYLVKG